MRRAWALQREVGAAGPTTSDRNRAPAGRGRRRALRRVDASSGQDGTIRRLFDDVGGRRRLRAAAFQPLVHLLAVHGTAGETVVYPALLWAAPGPGGVCAPAKREEDQAKDLAAFEGSTPAETVEVHAEAEEAEVLPLLDEHRAGHELRFMVLGFVVAETISAAPTASSRHDGQRCRGRSHRGRCGCRARRRRERISGRAACG